MSFESHSISGPSLHSKLEVARVAVKQHSKAFDELSLSIEDASRAEWLEMANRFHADKKQRNPYVPCAKKCE